MRIFSKGGDYLGKVTGNLSLHSEDQALKTTWESADREIPWKSADVEEWIACFLQGKGYIVE